MMALASHSSTSFEAIFPTMKWEVIKKHHRMGWLRQTRWLVVTGEYIINAKPGENGEYVATKRYKLTQLKLIALKSKKSFMIRFVGGDHDYFYKSEKALEILWEVRKRFVVFRSIDRLCGADAVEERQELAGLFLKGQLPLPQYWEQDQTVGGKIDVIRAIKGGALDHAEKIQGLVNSTLASASASTLGINLFTLREQFDLIKALLLPQLCNGERSLGATLSGKFRSRNPPQFADDGIASQVLEEALQILILLPLRDKLFFSLGASDDVSSEELRFQRKRQELSQEPVDFFGVPEAVRTSSIDLVLDSLVAVTEAGTPSAMLDSLVTVAKSIILSIAAAVAVPSLSPRTSPTKNFSSQNELVDHKSAPSVSVAADDVIPLYIYVLSRSKVEGLVFVREIINRLGDPEECSERSYYFTVFSSALEFVISGEGRELESRERGEMSPPTPETMLLDRTAPSTSSFFTTSEVFHDDSSSPLRDSPPTPKCSL